jgi:anti-sigma B factor antagonist
MSGAQRLMHDTVSLTGTLDLASAGDLQRELFGLIDAGHVNIIVDLSQVQLCDAAAMRVLVRAGERCAEEGGWLRLANPVGIVATAFRIVSLGRSVEVYPSMTAAEAGEPGDLIMR